MYSVAWYILFISRKWTWKGYSQIRMHVCFYGVLAHLQEFTDSSSVHSPVNLLSWIDRVHSIPQLHTFSFQSQQHGTYRVQRPAVSTLHHLVQRPPCWQQKFQWRRVAAEDWTSKTVGALVRSAQKQTNKQTSKQTNKQTSHKLQKSTIVQSLSGMRK